MNNNIAVLINTHGKIKETFDTIDFVKKNVSNNIVLLIDGVGWKYYERLNCDVRMLKGFDHGIPRSPYRNVFLGLIHTYKEFPNTDWLCYLEYDVVIASSKYLELLNTANQNNTWIVGADYRDKQNLGKKAVSLSYLEHIIKDKFQEIHYLLGCVLFYNKKLMQKLMENNFLEKMLYYTNDFTDGFFPNYTNTSSAAWDILEHMMPTLAKYWGGEITQLSKWDDKKLIWLDENYKSYPIRWYPEITKKEEYENASIIHPLKDYNSQARIYHRNNMVNLCKMKI